VVTLSMRMLGELTGQTLFVMQEGNAGLLCDVLLKREPGSSRVQSELEQSSLKETGNIMAGSFLNALSQCIGKSLLPSVPVISIAQSGIVGSPQAASVPDSVLVVETNFLFEDPGFPLDQLKGVFLFVLEDDAAQRALFGAISGA